MIWVLNFLSSPFVACFCVPVLTVFWYAVLRTAGARQGLQKSAHERDVMEAMFREEVRKDRRTAVLDSSPAVSAQPHEGQYQPYCQCPAHKNASARAAEVLAGGWQKTSYGYLRTGQVPLPPGVAPQEAQEFMERLVSSLQAAGLQVPSGAPGQPCAHPDAEPVYAGGELVAWLCPDPGCDMQLPATFRPDPGEDRE